MNKAVLKNFIIFTGSATLLKSDLTQVFSSEYCKTFKNKEHLPTVALIF